MKRRIVCLFPRIGQPRLKKRLLAFLQEGMQTVVFVYQRTFAEELNRVPVELKEYVDSGMLNVISLGTIINGNYIRRIPSFLSVIYKTVITHRELFQSSSLIYVSGHDLGFMMSLFYRKKIKLLEIADIIYLNKKNKLNHKILRLLERKCFQKYDALVMTSGGFIEYYRKFLSSETTYYFVPNKVTSLDKIAITKKPSHNKKIRISYIGFIRYPQWTLAFAEIIASMSERYELHFYGASGFETSLVDLSKKYQNIFFHGSFKNPQDLPKIYASTDITYACYVLGQNEKIAEPNKLYESLLFKVPILVQSGTYLSKRVQQLRSGYVVDITDGAAVRNFLDSLTPESVEFKSTNMSSDENPVEEPKKFLSLVEKHL